MRRSVVRVPLLAALVVAALVLAGCSGGSDSEATRASSDSGGGAESAPGFPGEGGATGDEADGATGGGAGSPGGGRTGGTAGAAADLSSVASGRVVPGSAVLRTGELTVRVDDVGAAADEAARTATAAGGSVSAEERSSGGDHGSAVVVMRVPPAAFDETLRRLAGLGEELDRRRGTQDVTEQVIDLDTRIATQRASVARVRALLDRADTIGEIVQVEAELTRRTADLESLEARLAVLEEQVELSTITLRLEGEDGASPPAGGPLGFGDGLAAGWEALVAVGRTVAVTVGALLPFAPLLLVAGGLLWRSRSRRATGGSPASPGPAGA